VALSDAAACGLTCFGDTPDLCGNGCVDFLSDPQHCGACEQACEPGKVCNSGECTLACGGATPQRCGDQCVDVTTNPKHCGDCDVACARGDSCSDGECQPICPPEAAQLCDNECVDLGTDPANCGACGRECGSSERCDEGDCEADVLDVSAASTHVCAILSTGEVACWGYNQEKLLGDPEIPPSVYAKSRVKGLNASALELSTGFNHSCARLENEELVCWGSNYAGLLARAPEWGPNSAEPLPVALSGAPLEITAGNYNECVLTSADQVECWGDPYNGIPLREGDAPTYQPAPVPGLPDALGTVDCGDTHCCVRRQQPSPDIYCWGSSYNGEMGETTPGTTTPPLEISGVPAVDAGYDIQKSLAVGAYHACALANDGEVYCFGNNSYSQLGYAGVPPEPFVKVELPKRAVAVFASYYSSCALLEDDQLLCWGTYINDPVNWWTPSATPKLLTDQPIRALSSFYDLHFLVLADGNVLSWGGWYMLTDRAALPQYEPAPCCEDL
jgi:alpha-tubulin suppressor-like RCC1 family protein